MAARVAITEAKAELASLIACAGAGEIIVVTRNGRPVARLAPLAQGHPIQYGDLRGLAPADDLSLPEDACCTKGPRTERASRRS
jgi:prevent-host-death family protein